MNKNLLPKCAIKQPNDVLQRVLENNYNWWKNPVLKIRSSEFLKIVLVESVYVLLKFLKEKI